MASIADVYVDIIPSTAAIAKGIEKALRDADKDVIAAKKRWQKELGNLKPTVAVDADVRKAEKKLDKLEKDHRTVDLDVDADVAAAEAKLDAISRDRTVHIDVDAAGAAIGSSLATSAVTAGTEAGTSASKAFASGFSAGGPAVAALAGAAVEGTGVLASMSGALGLIPGAAAAAGVGIGVLTAATLGLGDAIGSVGDHRRPVLPNERRPAPEGETPDPPLNYRTGRGLLPGHQRGLSLGH